MGVHACMCVRVCVPHIKPFFLPVDIPAHPVSVPCTALEGKYTRASQKIATTTTTTTTTTTSTIPTPAPTQLAVDRASI